MKQATPGDSKRSTATHDVDSYLAALPEDVRTMLEKLRRTIRATAPKAEEVISYQMPAYMYHGPLVFFAAFKDHCSLFAGRLILESFRRDLKPYHVSGSTIHFSVEKPLPASLVRRIVKARMAENESRAEQKLAYPRTAADGSRN